MIKMSYLSFDSFNVNPLLSIELDRLVIIGYQN